MTNFLVSTGELFGSTLITVLAILLPVICFIIVALICFLMIRKMHIVRVYENILSNKGRA